MRDPFSTPMPKNTVDKNSIWCVIMAVDMLEPVRFAVGLAKVAESGE